MRTDKQRIAKYKAKTDPVTVRRKVAARLPAMIEAYGAHAREMEVVERAVLAVLDQEKVAPIDHILYHAYAKQLWKCTKKYSRASLVTCAQLKKDKWLARGLDDRVLRRLAQDLFGITLA
jgi:hypothetical protein